MIEYLTKYELVKIKYEKKGKLEEIIDFLGVGELE